MDQITETITTVFWLTLYLIILLGIIYLTLSIIASSIKRKHSAVDDYKLTFLQIKLPPDNEIEIKAAEHMFSNLMGFKKSYWKSMFSEQYRISFEIVAKNTGIGFYIVAPDEIAPMIEKQVNAAYPSAEIDIVNPQEIWDRGEITRVMDLKLKGATYYPIKVYEEMKNDSLSSITNTMSKLAEDEVLAVQYVIQSASDGWRYAGRRFINSIKERANNPEKKSNIDTSFLEGIEKKTAHPGFYTKVRVIAIAKDKYTAEAYLQNMFSSFEQFTDINYNRFIKRKFLSNNKLVDDFIFRKIRIRDYNIPIVQIPIYNNCSVLNTVELATIFHFPNKNIETPNIEWLGARRSSAPVNIPTEGIYLGKSKFRGVDREIHMKEKDRTRHFYIVGQTGTGKSQFMLSMALQDIQNGEGVAIIDPHGTDIDELLEKIPENRIDDVILFDAADTEMPIGLNMLEAKNEEEKHMVINAFIALLYKLYDPNRQGIMGPQLERAIRNVMLTAMVDPQSTMVDVMRLLIDEEYSKKFIDKIEDPLVKRYWTDEVAKTSANRKGETLGYFVSKFDRFITESTMRNILGQSKTGLDLDKIMAEKKILLVDLAKGKIGEENSSFLGLLLIPRILSAALARHKLIAEGKDFPNFFLYVDEFQNFATPDFATILSEARKYKLNLTVAHQFIAQLDDKIKDAVFGNVGTMSVFRVGPDDAKFLEQQFTPKFTEKDLLGNPIGNCYVKLLVDGHPTAPFSMAIDWDKITATKRSKEVAQRIRDNSRMKYGTPASEVDALVKERMGINEVKKEEVEETNPFSKTRMPF